VPIPPYILWNRLQLQQYLKKVVYNIVETLIVLPNPDHQETASECEERLENNTLFKMLPIHLRVELQDLDEELYKLLNQ